MEASPSLGREQVARLLSFELMDVRMVLTHASFSSCRLRADLSLVLAVRGPWMALSLPFLREQVPE